jgi:hypothetical protein
MGIGGNPGERLVLHPVSRWIEGMEALMVIDRARESALAKENYRFFDINRDAIIAGHTGGQVLVRDCAVAGYFADIESACGPLAHTHAEPGSYIIQECVTGEDGVIDIGCHIPVPAFEVDWK